MAAGAWGTTGLLLVHAVPSAPDWISLALGQRSISDLGDMDRFATLLYEPFFLTGGLLTILGHRRCGKAIARAAPARGTWPSLRETARARPGRARDLGRISRRPGPSTRWSGCAYR